MLYSLFLILPTQKTDLHVVFFCTHVVLTIVSLSVLVFHFEVFVDNTVALSLTPAHYIQKLNLVDYCCFSFELDDLLTSISSVALKEILTPLISYGKSPPT